MCPSHCFVLRIPPSHQEGCETRNTQQNYKDEQFFYDLFYMLWVIQEIEKMRFHLELTLFTKKNPKEVKET